MRVEFYQGVPEGCTEWLNKHVGKGNITGFVDDDDYAWFYERIKKPVRLETVYDDPWRYVPTITVKDEKKAILFVMRWS
jgi:hypothetical protein